MIRGMSYPKGIFYLDKEHIAHASIGRGGEIVTHVFPLGPEGILFLAKRIILSFPFYAVLGLFAIIAWMCTQEGFPFYILLLALFGYHFFFPYSLKLYHGAEHKVFSYQGEKSLEHLRELSEADIVNRHCSTNRVVTFYILFLLLIWPLGGNAAALVALAGVATIPRWFSKLEEKTIFPISAFLQRKITTAEPDDKQLKVALLSYLSLVRQKPVSEEMLLEEARREREKMAKKESEQIIQETEWIEI